MRSLVAPLAALMLSALAGCAHRAQPVVATSCDIASVPSGAVFGTRTGMDIATWPPTMPSDGSGCQRVWYGERARPQAMQVLATYYYEGGHVQRLVGRVPNGPAYECHYRDGSLDAARSQNPAQCPKASELKPGG